MASPKGPTRAAPRTLSLAESATLAVICEGPTHGWEVGSALSPDGDIGQVWTLSRPLTYRAVDRLVDQGLVRRSAARSGQGRQRQVLRASTKGVRLRDAWLSTPVEHLRDVRTELLLKLLLAERIGISARALLEAQQVAFADHVDALTMGDAPSDLVSLWRRESARAVRRFLADAMVVASSSATSVSTTEASPGHRSAESGLLASAQSPPRVRLSARNQLRATVVSMALGDVMATVTVELRGGQQVMSAITKAAVDDLDLAAGDEVIVIIKSTEIIVAKP